MNIKELTKDLHDQAERLPFMKAVLTRKLSKEEYASYLYQLLAIYSPIEFSAKHQGMLDNLPGLERLGRVYQDYLELENRADPDFLLPETVEYHSYLINLGNDPVRRHLISAHMYVRHMGDLSGGQMVSKVVPGAGRMYQFDDIEALKVGVRALMDDDQDFVDEVRIAFKATIRILTALKSD